MKTVAVTGGTGSFGAALTRYLLKITDNKIVCISRSDGRQEALRLELEAEDLPVERVDFRPADVTDPVGIKRVLWDADWIIHAAALKRVDRSYEHATEYTRVNVLGTAHVLNAAAAVGSDRFLLVSSDKATAAHNPYGATKRIAEAMTLEQDESDPAIAASVVRGGNVWASDGSVMLHWLAAGRHKRPFHVTMHPATTRFHMPMDFWTDFVWQCMNRMAGGETFAPKLQCMRMMDLLTAFGRHFKTELEDWDPAPRYGDKKHEYLVSPVEAPFTRDIGWAYVLVKEPANGMHIDDSGVASDMGPWLLEADLMKLVKQLDADIP